MRAALCVQTLENAKKSYPEIKGCIINSDRGSQYTSTEYRTVIQKYGIIQSMNSAGGRCHDNARCESIVCCKLKFTNERRAVLQPW